jgi:hypothetical protein
MHALRVTSLVLGWSLAAISTRAQNDRIPPIFSEAALQREPLVQKLEAPEIVRPHLPLSNQMRSALNERVALDAARAPATLRPVRRRWKDDSDAILMERVVVNARREKKVEVESVPSYLAKVFTTGEIFHFEQRGLVPSSIQWGLRSVEATGYGSQRDGVRFEISATWHW